MDLNQRQAPYKSAPLTRLRYWPKGGPGENRIHALLGANEALSLAELQARKVLGGLEPPQILITSEVLCRLSYSTTLRTQHYPGYTLHNIEGKVDTL